VPGPPPRRARGVTGLADCFNRWLYALLGLGVAGKLGAMPNSYDPHVLAFNAIKETIRWNYDLTIGQLRKLGNEPPRFWIFGQPPQDAFRAFSEFASSRWIVALYVRQGSQELETA